MHERQMRARIKGIVGGAVHLVRLATPENAHLAGLEREFMIAHAVMHRSRHHIIHLDLRVPVGAEHDGRVIMKELKRCRHAFDAARTRLVEGSFGNLTFRQIGVPFLRDRFPAAANVPMFA
ncbi:hypothetical protein D3C78_1045960 [compost metagenome]